VRSALVHGATGPAPKVEETQVSPIPAYAQSANDMGGACAEGPEPGLQNGLTCSRASDDWALGLDPHCRLTVVFPTVKNDAAGSDEGTFASTQTAGGTPCPDTGTPGPTAKKLARRIKIAHFHGRAAGLEERWRRKGYIPFRAKTKPGKASGATGSVYRLVGHRRVLIAKTRKPVGLTIHSRTLRLYFAPGARVVAGRYVSAVTGTILGLKVRRARTFTLR
jgi:hypothetical protein